MKNLRYTLGKKKPLWLTKLLHYEYWPVWLFYLPSIPYWAYLALRARNPLYMTAANPGIEMGGFFGESKSGILDMVPQRYQPNSILVHSSDYDIESRRILSGLKFPLVAKPDVGERGTGIEVVHSAVELNRLLANKDQYYLLQAFSKHPLEFGILYYRIPGQTKGKILSITGKKFMTLRGDGVSSLQNLMAANPRFAQQINRIQTKRDLSFIPAKGEEILLDPIGNHCRGTEFLNCNELINDELVTVFDSIASEMSGFYFGRFDIKVASLKDLYRGENIDILEVNGTTSESGHIYDPQYSLWKAYRDIFKQMKAVYRVSIGAHRAGQAYTPINEFLRVIKGHFFGNRNVAAKAKEPVPVAA